MARKTKTFQIEGYEKSFTVKELTVKQIIDLMQKDVQDTSLAGLKDQFLNFLPVASNIKLDELIEMPPSDIKLIWDKFREINSTFFAVSQQVGLGNLLEDLKRAIIEDFGKLLVASSKLVIPES